MGNLRAGSWLNATEQRRKTTGDFTIANVPNTTSEILFSIAVTAQYILRQRLLKMRDQHPAEIGFQTLESRQHS
jgi:hypothetical protein